MKRYIQLSSEAVDKAYEWQRKIFSTGIERFKNRTGVAPPKNRYAIGYMGEFAFEWLLQSRKLPYVHMAIPNGKHHGPDFYCAGKSIDVKTAPVPTHRFFMVPEDYELEAEIYVGAKIEDPAKERPTIIMCGWLRRDEVTGLPVKEFGKNCPTRYMALDDLRAIDTLLDYLAMRQSTGQHPTNPEKEIRHA